MNYGLPSPLSRPERDNPSHYSRFRTATLVQAWKQRLLSFARQAIAPRSCMGADASEYPPRVIAAYPAWRWEQTPIWWQCLGRNDWFPLRQRNSISRESAD